MYNFDLHRDRPIQGQELNALPLNPERDEVCYSLAKYLADGLNYDLYRRTSKQAVSNILDYDGLTVDVTQFPLLKVYRVSDAYKSDTNLSHDNMVITYSLVAPEQTELPGILRWFSVSVNFLLDYYHHTHQTCCYNVTLGDRTAEYKIMYSEINNFAYPFFRIPFTVEEQICV